MYETLTQSRGVLYTLKGLFIYYKRLPLHYPLRDNTGYSTFIWTNADSFQFRNVIAHKIEFTKMH